ncbi:MAG: SDR family oxidoreductase [Bdellovibrionaceae bacterium]|nr:SDR family oxidoreductase [Pseudobdellovibrionaceae bacterium]
MEQEQKPQPRPPYPKQKQRAPGLESKLRPRPRFEAPLYKASGKLLDKRALITGGDSGIGRAVAVLYAREGADVAIQFLPSERSDAEATRDLVEAAGRRCYLIEGDLSEETFCDECVQQAVDSLGGLDILVSNAAHQMRKEKIEEISSHEWDYTFRVNIYAYFHLAKAAVHHMKPGSAIVATSSETGLMGNKRLLDYSATKGALNAFTMSLAQMLIDRGIRVNAVAPGPVWTPLNPSDEGAPPEKVKHFGEDTPMKRPAQPEEIAPAYVFLASDADSSYITGVILPELGGTTLM